MFKAIQPATKTRLFLSLLLIASPWLVILLDSVFTGHSVLESFPVWSDELSYWHEILSLSRKGLQHGYYTYNELVPAVSSFGPHGFGTVSVYALFAKVFGWKTYSMVIANAFFMSLAFLFSVMILKPTAKTTWFVLLFSISYTPFILFSVTSMSEGLNQAILIVYFTLLYAYFQREKKWLFVLFILFCTAISCVRIIYIVLFLPILFYRKNRFVIDAKLAIFVLTWLVFSVFLFLFSIQFVSPYPDSFLHELFNTNGIVEKMSLAIFHFGQNTLDYINPLSDNAIQVAERYFVLVVLVYSLIKSRAIQSKLKEIEIRYFVVFLILLLVLLITFAAYDVSDWRDYRVLAPILFGCIFYLILNSSASEAYGLLVINALILVLLIASPLVWKSFNADRYNPAIESGLLKQIEYTVQQKNSFENTVAVQLFDKNIVLNIPAGIGISTADTLSDKLQSKYVFSEKKLELTTYNLIYSNQSEYLYEKDIR